MPGTVPPNDDERELLLAFLAQQRDALRNAAHGLTDEQVAAAPSASTLSIGGLLKHVASVERTWMKAVTGAPRTASPDEYGAAFVVGPDDTREAILADLAAAAAETDAIVRGLDLDHPVPVPQGVPWFPADVEAWSVRWVVLHLIQETARHAGHADIVRETIDGATGYPLMAAVEGWPATEWLQPWAPATPGGPAAR